MKQQCVELTVSRGKAGWFIKEGLRKLAGLAGFCSGGLSAGLENFFPPEEICRLREALERGGKGGFTLVCAFGQQLPVALEVYKKGEATRVLLHVTGGADVRNRLKLYGRNAVGGLFGFLADEELTVLWYDQAYAEITGYTRQQFERELGCRASRLIYHEDLPMFREKMKSCVSHPGKRVRAEVRLIRRDRELRTVQAAIGYAGGARGGIQVLQGAAGDITAKRHEEELQHSAEQYRLAVGNGRCFVWEYDIRERRIRDAKALEMLLGVEGGIMNAPDYLIKERMVHKDSVEEFKACFDAIEHGVENAECVAKMRDAIGNYFPIGIRLSTIPDQGGPPRKAAILTKNLSGLYSLEKRSHEREEWWAALTYGQTFAARFDLAQGLVLEANKEIYPFYDSDAPCTIEELIGRNVADYIHPDDRAAYLRHFDRAGMMESFKRGVPELIFEYRASRHGEAYRWRQSLMHLLHDPATRNICAYVYVKDITGEKSREEELRRHAERDALTGLYNRMASEQKCGKGLEGSEKAICALIMLDLDDLKTINDAYGHAGGDEALKRVAECLQNKFCAWEGAVVGRLGGDEFIAFIPGFPSLEAIRERTASLSDVGQSPLPCALTCSVGVAVAPYDGTEFLSLYKCADAALYQAKRQGKNRVVFYDKSLGLSTEEKNPVSRDWLLEECSDLVYVADLCSYDMLYMNHGAKNLFGVEGESYKGRKCYKVIHGRSGPCEFCTNRRLARDSFYTWEQYNPRIGHRFLLRDRIVDWYGQPARIEFATDVTELDRRNKELQAQHLNDQVVIDCLRILDARNVVICEAVEAILSRLAIFYQAEGAFLVRRDRKTGAFSLCSEWHREGVEAPPYTDQEWRHYVQRLECMLDGKRFRLDNRSQMAGSDPTLYKAFLRRNTVCQAVAPVSISGQPAGFVGLDNPPANCDDLHVLEMVGAFLFEEMSRRRLEEQLAYLSYHDTLTRLQNRNSFQEYAARLAAARKPAPVGVLVCYFDGISEVNRYCGRSIGDQMIKRLAGYLRERFPKAKLFRIDGNEFLVFEEGISRELFIQQIRRLSDDEHELRSFGLSIGYTWSDSDVNAQQLVNQAKELWV